MGEIWIGNPTFLRTLIVFLFLIDFYKWWQGYVCKVIYQGEWIYTKFKIFLYSLSMRIGVSWIILVSISNCFFGFWILGLFLSPGSYFSWMLSMKVPLIFETYSYIFYICIFFHRIIVHADPLKPHVFFFLHFNICKSSTYILCSLNHVNWQSRFECYV